jgi:hypothetical protein
MVAGLRAEWLMLIAISPLYGANFHDTISVLLKIFPHSPCFSQSDQPDTAWAMIAPKHDFEGMP